MNNEQLNEILELHKKWLNDDRGGKRADLRNTDLRNVDLRNADLRNADLRNADLRNADLRNANLYGANLYGVNLRNANLYGVDLRNANLRGANLRSAYLRGADLRGADLRRANLYGADLRRANLRRANLYGADLRRANLYGCSGDRNYIKSLFIFDDYPITYTAEYLQIGCQRHKIEEWWQFDDRTIADMDGKTALKFWTKYKEFIRSAIELSPAKPTKEPEPCNILTPVW